MSGCHLLCRGFSCSHGFLLMSTMIRGVGVLGGMLTGVLLHVQPAGQTGSLPVQECCHVLPSLTFMRTGSASKLTGTVLHTTYRSPGSVGCVDGG
jgi:hypothetical protein